MAKKKQFFAQASVLKRLAAFAIDMLIINIILLWPFKSSFEELLPDTNSFTEAFNHLSSDGVGNALMILMFASSLITILYFVLLEKKFSQTPGKMLFKLFVRPQTKELKNWQLWVRSMFLIPIFPFVLLWFIDPIVMFFNKDNQRLSEILSKTKTVESYTLK
ncbi:RDD family protein [Candidatus Woesearchaeota archaeon]|nr:RDD family protein [Candidatus Woesearchaeota archaeon]